MLIEIVGNTGCLVSTNLRHCVALAQIIFPYRPCPVRQFWRITGNEKISEWVNNNNRNSRCQESDLVSTYIQIQSFNFICSRSSTAQWLEWPSGNRRVAGSTFAEIEKCP